MKFLPLLELYLEHPYYPDGRCPDFQVVPTRATQRLLKNHRCTLRSMVNGVRILTSVTDQNDLFLPLRPDAKFTFQLRLQNSDFALFTNLDALSQLIAPIYITADPSETLALASKQAETSETFVITQPGPAAQFTLAGAPLSGLSAADFSIDGLGPITAPAGYSAATKVIEVDAAAAAEGDQFRITYAVRPQQTNGIFAEVEIRYSVAWPAIEAGPKTYQIIFEAKAARWKYYIVADNPHTAFQIDDNAADPLSFSPNNRTDLSQNPDDSDAIATSLAQKYPAKQRFRFISDALIPCQQQPRKTLELRLAGNKVLETLPNPSLQNYVIDEINVDSSVQQEAGLYQIVKYLIHPIQMTGG